MKIMWLVDEVHGDWTQGYASRRASNRYRAVIPAQELRRLGHDVQLEPMASWGGSASEQAAPDLVVVSKQFGWNNPARYEQIASRIVQQLRAVANQGSRIVVDFCDDHFEQPLLGPSWRTLASMAHVCVAGSNELRETVQAHTGAPVVVVGDPISSPLQTPRVFRPQSRVQSAVQGWLGGKRALQRLRLVWFGNHSNVAPLFDWAQQLAPFAEKQPWWLTVVTTATPEIERSVARFNATHGVRAAMELVAWDETAQWEAVATSDLVLIPADISSAAKRVKTGNRMTDALHMGRFVIASPVPAYGPFSAFATLTEDPVAAVEAYLDNPAAILRRISEGQRAAVEHASPMRIAAEWLGAFEGVVDAPRSMQAAPAQLVQSPPISSPIRLNLGCGDKIISGYVNVDVVESRAGKSPDVICDLHQLTPFPDNHADEVLAVHVVEHFWRWEIEAVLREWMRILKPGGRMILECPNLQAACEAFLANPSSASGHGNAGQRTMWVFYGDPSWKDPLMVHRWGYTPASLAELMGSIGLTKARQEPAQFKLREPRDMRIVAEKPL